MLIALSVSVTALLFALVLIRVGKFEPTPQPRNVRPYWLQ